MIANSVRPRPDWFPDWSGDIAVIVASGPSATAAPVALARGRARVLAVNSSWRLCPWADALYASDKAWWEAGHGDDFAGLKVSRSAHSGVRQVSLRKDGAGWCDRILHDEPGVIGAGGCSGFQALNLAVQFGARRIALVGFDARVDRGSHWHGDHGGGLHNPSEATAASWRRHLDAAAPALAALGVAVINASPLSLLQAFPRAPLEDALNMDREDDR